MQIPIPYKCHLYACMKKENKEASKQERKRNQERRKEGKKEWKKGRKKEKIEMSLNINNCFTGSQTPSHPRLGPPPPA